MTSLSDSNNFVLSYDYKSQDTERKKGDCQQKKIIDFGQNLAIIMYSIIPDNRAEHSHILLAREERHLWSYLSKSLVSSFRSDERPGEFVKICNFRTEGRSAQMSQVSSSQANSGGRMNSSRRQQKTYRRRSRKTSKTKLI